MSKKSNRSYVKLLLALLLISTITYFSTNKAQVNAATNVSIFVGYHYQTIPASSANGWSIANTNAEALYKVRVYATLSGGGGGIAGRKLTFSDPNTSTVKRISPAQSTTDGSYNAFAEYEVQGVRSFSITVSIDDGTYTGSQTSLISSVLESDYDSGFTTTCYITADEQDYTGTRTATAPGITGTYKQSFLNAVKLNGSGWSEDNTWIRYNSSTGNYSFTAPTTATGTTPVAGKTIAVDPEYVPQRNVGGWKRGTLDITNVGQRLAEDRGGAIKQYRIDIYTGIGNSTWQGNSMCGSPTYSVRYLGNNKL